MWAGIWDRLDDRTGDKRRKKEISERKEKDDSDEKKKEERLEKLTFSRGEKREIGKRETQPLGWRYHGSQLKKTLHMFSKFKHILP